MKLGGTASVLCRKGEERIRLVYKQPTTQQIVKYTGELANLRSRLEKDDGAIEAALSVRIKHAKEILVDVSGDVEVPEGVTKVDAVREFGFELLQRLAEYAFEGRGGDATEIDLGKSDETPPSSTEDSSASGNGSMDQDPTESTPTGASTSPRSTDPSQTSAADSAPTA
jgi:hypothetical protein